MKRVLILAYAFPPVPYSGSYRILRLCKGLNELNVKTHVLTIKIDRRIPNDFDLLEKIPKSVSQHRTAIFDPWLWFRDWITQTTPNKCIMVIKKLISFLLRFITIPDHQIFWVPFVVFKGFFIIRKNKIKTLVVSSPPNSSLLSGCILKKLTKIKFIADLRDPIVGNIAQVNLINPTTIFSKFELLVLKWLEKIVVKNADIVITNTKTHNEEMKDKYGNKTPFMTIRNSFDPDDYIGKISDRYEAFTISHLGGLYGLRKVDLLFQGIKKLEQKRAPSAPPLTLKIQLIGSTSPDLKQAIRAYDVGHYVDLLPRIPHKEAIEVMCRSDVLLIIKATGEGSLGQIPAKFFEYLGTGNPILCVGPKESELAGLIRKQKAGYVIEDSIEEMSEAIESLMQIGKSGLTTKSDSILLSEFNNVAMAKKFNRIIR